MILLNSQLFCEKLVQSSNYTFVRRSFTIILIRNNPALYVTDYGQAQTFDSTKEVRFPDQGSLFPYKAVC